MYLANQDNLESAVIKALREKGLSVFCAESCTGGLICKRLTDVPGASSVVYGGVVSYVNDIKTNVLGVSSDTISAFTEVSEQCAKEMAEGARRISGADIGLCTTGYASGGEGVPTDMIGVVYVAISDSFGTNTYRLKLDGNRCDVREGAVDELLDMLLCRINAY